MKPKKRLTQKIGFDSALATLMATGMAGLLVATRDDEPPQEEALWERLFNTINVPQNEVAPPVEVPLNRTVTEARLLLEVSFDDAVIDAAGFALRVPDFVALEEELVRIENGNEVWLVANIDLDDHFNLSYLPISIISLADPTLFRILDIHVGPPGDATFEDTYFTFDKSGEEGADEMESGSGGAHDAGIEPCEEVIENYAAAEPVEDFSLPGPDIL
mgnify:CR=1 FL=1